MNIVEQAAQVRFASLPTRVSTPPQVSHPIQFLPANDTVHFSGESSETPVNEANETTVAPESNVEEGQANEEVPDAQKLPTMLEALTNNQPMTPALLQLLKHRLPNLLKDTPQD